MLFQRQKKTFNVECFNNTTNQCVITGPCLLGGIFAEALEAYLSSLSKYSLADLIKNQVTMRRALTQRVKKIDVVHIDSDT